MHSSTLEKEFQVTQIQPPLVGNDGTINHFSGFTDTDAYYISPCVDITGSEANSVTGSFTDVSAPQERNQLQPIHH